MVDITPVLDVLFELFKVTALAAISVVGPLAVSWVINRTKLDQLLGEDVVRRYMYEVLESAIVWGEQALNVKYAETNKSVEVKNQILAMAAKYAAKAVPDALARFGIDPTTAEGQARLQEMLAARFEKALGGKAEPELVDGFVPPRTGLLG